MKVGSAPCAAYAMSTSSVYVIATAPAGGEEGLATVVVLDDLWKAQLHSKIRPSLGYVSITTRGDGSFQEPGEPIRH